MAILTVLVPSFISAKEISEQEARTRASNFRNSSAPMSRSHSNADRLTLAHTTFTKKMNVPAFYVFNSGIDEGFIIVSGDDRLPSVLGYSTTGSFDSSSLPPALEWMLDSYQQEIEHFLENSGDAIIGKSAVSTTDDREIIEPLLSTKWSQHAPYNDLCPSWEGEKCPTGCVATAIAQIINYHQSPDKGEGTYSYQWADRTLSFDYENTEFHWDRMRDEYDFLSSDTSAQEVAKLMYACGVGVRMGYSPSGSGSNAAFLKRLLVENMKYDTDAEILWINNYSPSEWTDIIHSELSAGRPVYAEGGNHAFVCDGYAGDSYFHFNWGWGGYGDGNFLFSALSPSPQYSFHKDLNVLTNIKKRENGKQPLTGDIIYKGDFIYDTESDSFRISPIENWSTIDLNVTLGIEVFKTDTEESKFFRVTEIMLDKVDFFIHGSGPGSFKVDLSSLSPGNYKICPAYTISSHPWRRLRCLWTEQDHVDLNISNDGTATYTNPGPSVSADLDLVKIEIVENGQAMPYGYTHEDLHLVTTVRNNSEFPALYIIKISKDNQEIYQNKNSFIVEPNSELESGFNIPAWLYDFTPGEYEVNLYNTTGELQNPTPLTFTIVEKGLPDLEATAIAYTGKNEEYGYTYLNLTVKNNADYSYNQSLLPHEIRKDGFKVYTYKIPSWYIAPKSEVTMSMVIYTLLSEGDYEMDVFDYTGKKINSTPLTFTVSDNASSVENISKENVEIKITESGLEITGLLPDEEISVYDIMGHRVSSSKAIDGSARIQLYQKGLYIIKSKSITRKISIR